MARRLDSYQFSGKGRAKYDWDRWMDGSIWRLDAEDYNVAPESFRVMALREARRRQITLTTSVDGDEVVIQASVPKEAA